MSPAKAAELLVSRDIEAREITVDLALRTDELGWRSLAMVNEYSYVRTRPDAGLMAGCK